MDSQAIAVAEECTRGSDEGRLSFPEVVRRLSGAGVERYRADLVRAEKTYFLPTGENVVIAANPIEVTPAATFSAAGVEAAVRAAQAGRITYGEFCARIAAAGCAEYLVSLSGRRALYLGRTAEAHVELFPQ